MCERHQEPAKGGIQGGSEEHECYQQLTKGILGKGDTNGGWDRNPRPTEGQRKGADMGRMQEHRQEKGGGLRLQSHNPSLALAGSSEPLCDPRAREISMINSKPFPPAVLQERLQTKITVLELFGGLAGGLEMLLRNRINVNKYIYCDNGREATLVAQRRLGALTLQFPGQLKRESWSEAFTAVPQDVYRMGCRELISAGALGHNQQWIVIGGFECQDLSSAGAGRGFEGQRSVSFFPLLDIVRELQDIQKQQPPIYLIENTAMVAGKKPTFQVQEAYRQICQAIGDPVILDATTVGSHAHHRLRNYWTNLAWAKTLQRALDEIVRDPSIKIEDILPSHLQPQICTRVHQPPYYPANEMNKPIKVLSTLVATVNSYAFRGGGQGMLLNTETGFLVDVPIETRERAMGYHEGATASPDITWGERHKIIGRAFDANAVQCLWAVAVAISLETSNQLVGSATALRSGRGFDIERGATRERVQGQRAWRPSSNRGQ